MTDSGIDRLLIVGPEDAESYWVGSSHITVQAGAADTDGRYGLFVSRAPAGSSPPLHVHGADEAVWVSQGRVARANQKYGHEHVGPPMTAT